MHLTMNTGMNLRRHLELSIRSANSARYTDSLPLVRAAKSPPAILSMRRSAEPAFTRSSSSTR